MISKTIRKLTTLLLAAAMLITVFQGISVPVRAAGQSSAKAAFAALKQDYELYGVLTNDADIPVYKQADTGAAVIKTLPSGSQVTLTDAVWDTQTLWFKIGFAANGTAYSGYVESRYVATADARLAEWEEKYLPAYAVQSFGRGAAKNAAKVSSFPESYRPMLKKLLQAHPNWTFVPMNTGLEWADVLKAEMTDSRNLVQTYHPDTWKSTKPGDYNAQTGTWTIKSGTDWVQASEAIVKFYLDPRNFLPEESVFQFEQLVYGSHHTKAGVEKILSGTFMANKKLEDKSGGKITYSQAFMKIGKSLKVSPYFLASRVRQEQGAAGDSSLISGSYPGYKGYYNYFNKNATGIGTEVIISGLNEAKENGWNTRYKALKGGAKAVASDYIYKGQDTFYLQKFDVDPSYNGLYWHQYMQNLSAADTEGKNVQKSYQELGILQNAFVFKVPVYNNMPSLPCPKPEKNLSMSTIKITNNDYASVTLSWNESAAAHGYQIYRSTKENGSFQKIATVNADTRSFTDTSVVPGKLYRYKVRAYMKLGSKNKYSSYSDTKTADLTIPATAWKTCKVKKYRTVELSWKKKSVDGYKIYRKTGNGKFVCIQTLSKKSSVSFKDTSVKPGSTYTYRIRGYITVNGKNYYSSYTPVQKTEIQMAKPTLKKVSSTGRKKIKLTWKRDSKADGYYIYRSSSQKGGYKKVKTVTKNKTVTWTDKKVKSKKTYYYKIRSYVNTSTGTKSSKYSSVVSVRS